MSSLPLEANAAATLAEWHELIARRDLGELPRLLHPDAVFRSPMAHKPYAGAPVVSTILNTVLTVFEDFAYHRQLASADGRSVVLEFSARVGERELKGIDMIRFGDDGRIVDFEVMVRPMSGLQALARKWAGAWRPIWPRARPEALASGPGPDAAVARTAASARRGVAGSDLPAWAQRCSASTLARAEGLGYSAANRARTVSRKSARPVLREPTSIAAHDPYQGQGTAIPPLSWHPSVLSPVPPPGPPSREDAP